MFTGRNGETANEVFQRSLQYQGTGRASVSVQIAFQVQFPKPAQSAFRCNSQFQWHKLCLKTLPWNLLFTSWYLVNPKIGLTQRFCLCNELFACLGNTLSWVAFEVRSSQIQMHFHPHQNRRFIASPSAVFDRPCIRKVK